MIMREPDQIRDECAKKLTLIQISDHFRAILGCLLQQDWTTPRLVGMIATPDGHLLGRCEGQATEEIFLGSTDDLIRNIHGLGPVAELDGDEIGYLVAKIAEIKRQR